MPRQTGGSSSQGLKEHTNPFSLDVFKFGIYIGKRIFLLLKVEFFL